MNMAATGNESPLSNLKSKGPIMIFSTEDEEDVVDKIRTISSEFLCVAMGSPKQEKFVHRNSVPIGTLFVCHWGRRAA